MKKFFCNLLGAIAAAMPKSPATRVLATVMATATPTASVTCGRQLVPDHTIEVQTPSGIGFKSGGGKTTISGGLPYGISVKRD